MLLGSSAPHHYAIWKSKHTLFKCVHFKDYVGHHLNLLSISHITHNPYSVLFKVAASGGVLCLSLCTVRNHPRIVPLQILD